MVRLTCVAPWLVLWCCAERWLPLTVQRRKRVLLAPLLAADHWLQRLHAPHPVRYVCCITYPCCLPPPFVLCRKICDRPVDEDLRATIRAFCTGPVAALNKYYAFGSAFAEEV